MEQNIAVKTFERPGLEVSPNLLAVRRMREAVLKILTTEKATAAIADAHVFNASSHSIQAVLLDEMVDLGFSSEKKGLFADYAVKSIRPDYFLQIEGGGILFEVERGKTIANNMDLLDMWKTHICLEAKHLFLLVPQIRVQGSGKKQIIFNSVTNRLESFFLPSAHPVDVDTVTIFGY